MKNKIISTGIVGLLVISGFVGLFVVTDQVNAPGPTYVTGPITSDTTWYLTNSPYIVIGDVTVQTGAMLTIEPGVEVKFDGVYSIVVDGKLIADGTSADKIKFTSNQITPAKGDWYTIRLRTESNLINYAEVEYATYGIFMTLYGANNTISNTTIKYCKYDGIYIKNSDYNTISNCTVTSNDRFGITIYESHSTKVDNTIIQYNNFFGINLNASTYTQVHDCNVSYNDGKGILFYSNSHHTTISECEIDCNNHIGIDLSGTSNNNLINTRISGNNGRGIDFGGVTTNQWIENCIIIDNEGTGIDLRGSSYVEIVGCNISKNKGKGGIYSASPVNHINITNTEVLNNPAGNGIDFYEAKWVNITYSNISENAGNGISFNGSHIQENNIIKNCSIAENSNNGIYFYAYKSVNIIPYLQKNTICSNIIYSNTQNGIYFYVSSSDRNGYAFIQSNNIYANTIYSNRQNGIYFCTYRFWGTYIQNNNIYSNTIYSNNQNGVCFLSLGSDGHYVQNNNIYSNSIHSNGKNGIYFHGLKGSVIYDYYIQNNNIYSNIIYSNGQNGICFYAYARSDSYIQNNNIYSNTIYQHIGGNSSLGDALDKKTLYFTTGGDAYWVVDTSIYYYDGDSAKSGNISHNQKTYIETTVIGPGILKFYWKVSSASNDYLVFSIDDDNWIDYIVGEVDWHQKIYNISSGLHILKWRYIKYDTGTSGSDCGWLDKVEFSGIPLSSGILLYAENVAATWQESNIYNNTIVSNMYSIILLNMKSQVIHSNNISSNNEGILLDNSNSSTIRYNTITNNNWTGINLTYSSSDNNIENNNISFGNGTGIFISDNSNNNLLTRNDIMNNSEGGLKIIDASGNQIHHNNFKNNTQNAYDSTIALNDWDDGTEGNCWSDYLGTDDDGDGFGEDPYVIPGGGSRDWHPFMNPLDITAPYIISTSPLNGDENIPVDTTISITFSKEMNTTAVESAISISGGLLPVGFVWDAENKIVTFTTSSNLTSETTYTVTITTEAKDILGNWMEDTYTFSFTSADVEPPKISVTSPFDGETNVEISTDIIVTFNEPMERSTVTYSCTPDPDGWGVSWSSDSTIATFSHDDFGSEVTYSFQITSGKDTANLDLVAGLVPNPWSFTTLDVLGPEITSTSPIDGSQNVSTTANIVVYFNEQMDNSSLTYACMPDPLGWSVTWTNEDKTATFLHNEFAQKIMYTFEITDVKDISGNDLNPSAIPNPWSFTTTGDYVPPQISLTSPANNAVNVDPSADVVVTFSEAMDTSSLNYICIPDPGGWSERWSAGNMVVTLSHNPFNSSEIYEFQITGAKDLANYNLMAGATPNPWSFQIADVIGPKILGTSPLNCAENVVQTANVVVKFSEEMDISSLSFICNPNPGDWSILWSSGITIATFTHNPFDSMTNYTFHIIDAKDLAGNDLVSDSIPNPWWFITIDSEGPTIISTSPLNGAINIGLNKNIIVTFSEQINISSVTFSCDPDPGGWDISWSAGNTVAALSHDPFIESTMYTFQITSARDLAGNNLVADIIPNPWSFTTTDPMPPTIINTVPVNNEAEVGLDANVIVIFSEPMNTNSVTYMCTPDPGGWNIGWSSDNIVATISHNPFAMGTTYTFHITAGKDIDGNNLTLGEVPHSWNFTTISVNSLIVTPSEVNITQEGTVVLIAQAYDLQNNPITDITYIWSMNNNLGTVSPQGSQIVTFIASSNVGNCYVNVTAGGKSASAFVTIKSDDLSKKDTEDSLPEDMILISLLWVVIIIACIVIVVVVLWKKGSKPEVGPDSVESVTSEETVDESLDLTQESMPEPISPPPPPTDDSKQPPSTSK